MMAEEEACDVGLALGLGVGGGRWRRRDGETKSPVQLHILFPSHHPKEEEEHEESARGDHGVKRSRGSPPEEEDDVDVNDGANKEDGSRKKLRLTKEQSSLLEDSFRQRSTLNPVLKKELSDALNLRPRQVEVWFQNRRARTKLKKTEVDCEFLKKCCQSLSEENRRLKEELQELRSTKQASPYYMRLMEATTVMMCPSCERIAAGDGAGKSGSGDSETTFDATTSGLDTKSKLYGYCTTTVN